MTTQTAVQTETQAQAIDEQDLIKAISALSSDAKGKLAHYVAFLKYEDWVEEQEDAEDIAYINAHRDDPVVPFDIKEFESE
jgi:hypothetical protein